MTASAVGIPSSPYVTMATSSAASGSASTTARSASRASSRESNESIRLAVLSSRTKYMSGSELIDRIDLLHKGHQLLRATPDGQVARMSRPCQIHSAALRQHDLG